MLATPDPGDSHGTLDDLVPTDHATEFYAALQEAGVTSELYRQRFRGHPWRLSCVVAPWRRLNAFSTRHWVRTHPSRPPDRPITNSLAVHFIVVVRGVFEVCACKSRPQ